MKMVTILGLLATTWLGLSAGLIANATVQTTSSSVVGPTCIEIFQVEEAGESYQKCQGLGDYEIGIWNRHGWNDLEVIYSGTIAKLPAGVPDLYLTDVYGRTDRLEVEWRLNSDNTPKGLIVAREVVVNGKLQAEYHVFKLDQNNTVYLESLNTLAKARKLLGR